MGTDRAAAYSVPDSPSCVEASSLLLSRSQARSVLSPRTVERLEALGYLRALDERAARARLRELEDALDALEELQVWVESRLADVTAA